MARRIVVGRMRHAPILPNGVTRRHLLGLSSSSGETVPTPRCTDHARLRSTRDASHLAPVKPIRQALARLDPTQREALAHVDGYARAEPADLVAILATLVTLAAEGPDDWTPDGPHRFTPDRSRPRGV